MAKADDSMEVMSIEHFLELARVVQNERCCFTGDVLTPATATPDHGEARSHKGVDHASNIFIVTSRQNSMKGTMDIPTYFTEIAKVYEYHNLRKVSPIDAYEKMQKQREQYLFLRKYDATHTGGVEETNTVDDMEQDRVEKSTPGKNK